MATSPPTPTNLTLSNSRKRPSIGAPTQSATAPNYPSQAAKRPKHQHPLRQTSFPATDAQAGLYTPTAPRSETGSVSASLASGVSGTTAGGGKRSRGRPKKRKNQPQDIQTGRGEDDNNNNDGASTTLDGLNSTNNSPQRGRRGGTKSIISGTGPANAAEDAQDDDDDPNAPLADPNSDESRLLHAEIAKEKENIAQLQEALTPDQMQRYVVYNRTKLKLITLKRIVNQTVSQSVTANPLQAVQWVGKVFVGEIVEAARVVQEEWAERWEVAGEEERQRREMQREEKRETEGEEALRRTTVPTVKPTEDLYAGANPHRGGLLPDHLREAVRKYKAEGEGGGVGFGGYSFGNMGVKGEAVPRLGMGSAGGRRLFR
jgi:transcription initiation factor TFIID subunit 11